MIRIRKGSNEFTVSQKAYEDMFKKLGYSIVGKEDVGVVPSTIPTQNTLETELVEEEKKENELKENNVDVVTSKDLTSSIGAKIEEDFGFEEETKLEEPKKNEAPKSEDLYAKKLQSLKSEENPKPRK